MVASAAGALPEVVGGAGLVLPAGDAAALAGALVEVEMPFGKYKGRLLADLPGNYLNWFAREGFPPGELGRLLALMHEIDHTGLRHLLAPVRAAKGDGTTL